jgi:type IV pilus assembly protein PilP
MSRLTAAHKIAMILMVTLALSLSGCEDQKGSTKEPVVTKQIGSSSNQVTEQKSSDVAGKGKPMAAVPVAEQVAVESTGSKRMPYNPIGKIDPFAPLFKEETEKTPEKAVVKPKEPERPRTPLEKLDLAQLKLTAIVTTNNQKRALVEEASGKGYVVEIGTKIGLERGSVVEIGPDRIVIESQGEDDFGNAKSRKRELKLQKPPGD